MECLLTERFDLSVSVVSTVKPTAVASILFAIPHLEVEPPSEFLPYIEPQIPNFKPVEFDGFKHKAGSNSFSFIG